MVDDNDTNEGFDLSPSPRVDTSYLYEPDIDTAHQTQKAVPTKAERIAAMEALQNASKGEIFLELQRKQHLTEYGVPEFIYRADLIPANIHQLPPQDRRDILDSAIVPISFEYGYPSTLDAKPLWEQLPGEPQSAFDAFCLALDLPEVSKNETPVRLLPILAPMLKLPLTQVAEYCHVYYWHTRFRAYDLYLAACHRKQREQRVMSIEGKHFSMAERYLAKIDKVVEAKLDQTILALNDSDSGELDELKLKDLVDMVEKLTKIQRISIGLPANGNDTSPTREIGGRNQSVEDSFKEIAAHAAPAKKTDTRSADMDAILENPDDLAAVQDLLIKFHQS